MTHTPPHPDPHPDFSLTQKEGMWTVSGRDLKPHPATSLDPVLPPHPDALGAFVFLRLPHACTRGMGACDRRAFLKAGVAL
jgi:hypothetical protein